ncbi:MAG: alpha/beta hydrolase [Gammaproteobacteria bacterium]|nr:alpha/beta hydrolase [Gammaproteobacteria bacterium]
MDQSVAETADGVSIAYQTAGTGQPALVFIHGWSSRASHWRAQLPRFAENYQVVAVDLGGHGHSGTNRDRWDLPAFADDVVTVADALDLQQIILVGHSMGAVVMVEAASRLGDRVIGLVATDTLHNVEQLFPPGALEAVVAGLHQNFRAGTRGFVEALFVPDTDPALRQGLIDDVCAANPEVAIPAMESVVSYDVVPALERVKAPVHCINSDMVPSSEAAGRRHCAEFTVEIMPGLGHFPQLEAPESFNHRLQQTIDRFVSQAGGA